MKYIREVIIILLVVLLAISVRNNYNIIELNKELIHNLDSCTEFNSKLLKQLQNNGKEHSSKRR
jgi:hypothetical protein